MKKKILALVWTFLILSVSSLKTFGSNENDEKEAKNIENDFIETYFEQIFRELRASKCLQDEISLENFENFGAKFAQSLGPKVRSFLWILHYFYSCKSPKKMGQSLQMLPFCRISLLLASTGWVRST